MKRLFVVMLTVVAVVGLVGSAMAGDKLLVKDAAANNILRVEADPAMVNVTTGGTAKSSLHFSLGATDTGGYVTSVADNNFFLSSGAAYNAGQWIQKSADNNSVVAGSGGSGYSIYLQNAAVGVGNPVTLALKLRLGYNGAITTGTGASLTSGGVWTNASSREYKENIETLSSEKAMATLTNLTPVTYNYKVDSGEKHVGFIAEDVPDLVATKDRKGLSAMDIVAVLTKVVQEQTKTIEALAAKVDMLEKTK
jgi:hypothetical protein